MTSFEEYKKKLDSKYGDNEEEKAVAASAGNTVKSSQSGSSNNNSGSSSSGSNSYEAYRNKLESKYGTDQTTVKKTTEKERVSSPSSSYNLKTGIRGYKNYLSDKEKQAQAEQEKKESTSWLDRVFGYLGSSPDSTLPMSNTTIAMDALRNDTSYKEPSDDWNDSERYIFGYLYETDKAAAEAYAASVNNAINKAKKDAKKKEVQDKATKSVGNGVVQTAGSVVASALGGADYLTDLVESIARGQITERSGDLSPFEYSQAVQEGIGTHLNEKYGTLDEKIPVIGGRGLGDVYGLGTSIAQSSFAAYTGGGAQALIQFFGSAAADGIDDAKARGASDDQAIMYGTMAGLAEAIPEMLSIDSLLKIGSSDTLKSLFKNLLKQSGAEGIEEITTSVLDNFADNLVMGDFSNLNIKTQQYMSEGLSEEEAKKRAWIDIAEDIAFDGLAGFVSGGIHAAPQTAFQTYMANKEALKTYGTSIDALIEEGLSTPEGTRSQQLAQDYKAKIEQGKTLSGAEIRMLVEANEQGFREGDTEKIKTASEKRLKELGESDNVTAIAEILARQAGGEALTKAEQKILESSQYAQRVANELSPENIRSGSYSSSWAENIGTDRINADLYNLAQETVGATMQAAPQSPAQTAQNVPQAKQETAGAKVQTSETTSQPKVKNAVQSEFKASESGKTINNITGSESDIAEIVKIKNGEMTLKLENGETVNAKNVSYGSKGEALIYETVAKLDNINAYAADVLVKAYNPSGNISADIYARGIEEAYRYGKYNIPVSEMLERGAFSADLTAEQRNKAYKLGQMFGGKSVAKAQAIKTVSKKAAQSTMGQVKNASSETKKGRVHFDGNMESLNERQRTSVSALEKISEALGVDFYLFESEEINGKRQGANGWYDPKDGSIHIDIYAGQNGESTMLFTAAHELTHFIKQWSPAKFKVLANFLMQEYGREGVSVAKLVSEQQEKAARNGREISYDVAYEEVIADSMETMLADGNVMEKLAQLKAKDKTLWEKIKSFIDELVSKIREVYSGLTPNTAEGRYVAEMKGSIEKIQQLFTEGLVEAGENYQSELESQADVKYSVREEDPPNETIKGYKVFFVKNGKLYPPMVANPGGEGTLMGVWLNADDGAVATNKDGSVKTNSFGRPRVKAGGKGTQGGSGDLAYRPGWHLGDLPLAKQFARQDENGNKTLFPEAFVWAECDVAADVNYQAEADAMGYKFSKNGKFNHQQASLDHMPREADGTAGFYRYRTNPDPTTEAWIITGAMKVNRLLTDAEVADILRKNGREPMKRQGGELNLKKLGLTEADFEAKSSNTSIEGKKFSLRENVEETKDLVAVHNLSEEKLLKSLKLGGLPMPSIAILRARDGHSEFGEISLVFNKDTIDPETYRTNKVYSGDAWTPTYPAIDYKLNEKAQTRIRNKINELVPQNIQEGLDRLYLDSDNMEDTLNRYSGNMVDAFKYNNSMKYAFLVDSGKGFELPMTDDVKAARELISEKLNQTEYEKWLKDLFSDIVEKEGIRNNRDYFTPSGNRRSFEALHYEHNLENVIKAMREKGDKGIGGFGNGNIFGASTTEFSSIKDIKKAKDRLQNIPEKDFEAIKKGFSDRFFELASSLPKDKKSFLATDDAADMLVEAVLKFKTKSGMANYIRKESEGWANYHDYVVDDLMELVQDIKNMPTAYFEAKPNRAVGFDEVAAVIIPDNLSTDTKKQLDALGMNVVSYESGNEQARLDALNSVEGVKFSLRSSDNTDSEAAKLREQFMAKREELQQNDVKQDELEDSKEYEELISMIKESGASPEVLAKYKEWDNKTGFSEIVNRGKQLAAEAREIYARYEKALLDEEKAQEAKSIEKSGLSETDYHRKQAVKEFGYTPYFYDAGYILPNGKMLNFSGEKGAHYGSRGQDHRAIGTIYVEDISGSEAMVKFMSEGNIRIMPEGPSVDISSTQAPTNEQYATIRKFVRTYSQEKYFSIDFTDAKGKVVGSYEYEGKISAERVVNDIKYFFENGETRPESTIGKFLYSLRDSDGNELSKEQQEYFKDSKVRDENGNLLVMYHGTPNGNFTTFRSGSYFTQNPEYAEAYQSPGASSISVKNDISNPKTYKVYLDIKKPFDTRQAKERRIFMQEFYMQWGNGAPLGNSGLPDWVDGMDLQEFIEEKGYDYDGLILDEGATGGYGEEVKSRGLSYVTFSPEQVKNIDNKTPTSDPDIRFSDRDYMDAVDNGDMETAQKMVDEAAKKAGYTVKAYHGTDDSFTVFDREKIGSKTDYGWFGKGFYFHVDADTAKIYGQNNMGAYLKIDKLMDLNTETRDDEGFDDAMDRLMGKKHEDNNSRSADFTDWLIKNGYDGVAAWGQRMVLYPEQIKSADPVVYDDNKKVVPLSQRFDSRQKDIRYSDRDYSYNALVSKPDMKVTTVGGNIPTNRADVVAQAKKNAAKLGKFNSKDGNVSVYVNDIDTDVVLGTPGLKHSLDRRFNENAAVTLKAGEIIQNSIRINELTPQKAEAKASYVLIGAAKNENGDLYIVRSVVNRFSNELASMDVLYAINAKKENRLRSMRPGFQRPVTDSAISIANLLDYVNKYFPDILPEEVLKHYGHTSRPEGKIGENALFQDRPGKQDSKVQKGESKLLRAVAKYFGVSTTQANESLIPIIRELSISLTEGKSNVAELQQKLYETAFEKGSTTEDLREEYSNIRKYIQGTSIYVDEGTRSDFGGDYESFRKENMGKLRLTSDPKAISIDDFYSELVGMSLGFDSENTDPKAQLESIASFMDSTGRNTYGLDRYGTKEEFIASVGQSSEVMDALMAYYTAISEASKGGEDFVFKREEGMSNRSLLANAFEGIAQNGTEARYITEYRKKIDLINSEEAHLREVNEKIKELSFAKGPKDTKQLRELHDDARKTANRISVFDKQLLRLEATKPLQDVLAREKKAAYRRAEQKGKQALSKYREKAVATQKEIMTRYQESRKKAVEGRQQTAMRNKVKGVVAELNHLLLNGTKDRHVMIGLQKAVAEALDAVNMDTIGAEERVAKYDALIAKATDPDVIASLTATRDRIRQQGDNLAEKIAQLKAAYGDIKNSDDPLVANGYDEVIAAKIDSVVSTVGNTPLRAMSTEQLEAVYDMYRMVLTRIRGANESFKSDKKEAISTLANRVMAEVEHVGGKHPYRLKGAEKIEGFMWNNLKPVYAFERIGSKTLTEVYNNVRAGEDTFAKDVTEAREFFVKENRKYHYDKWNMEKGYTFKSKTGQSFKLTIPQIMSLYAYSKRNQADKHLELGGFVFDSNIEVTQKKNGIPVKYTVNTATAHNISKETLGDIIGKLTAEQKAFVDEMQDFLSTTMGEKGNEVSLKMYGVKLFKEQHYFPLKSAKQFMFEQNETAGEVKLKNSGFSKETVVNASNPIILSNFMDVWANHVNDMSMYHSFVLPLEDFNRVFNYKTPNSESLDTESVKQFIQNAYGKEANAYIKQLLTDLNGGAVSDPRETTAKRLISNFKKAAVFSSASVVIQQPSAIGRALAIIDPKYFVGGKIGARGHNALWAEVKKYAPVAIIKEMGYFDTNMGRSTVDFITAKEYRSLSEKAKGLVTDSGYRDEVLSKAPALADEVTWCAIWNAVKRETKATHKELRPGSEEFLKAAGARFTEVITKTQVYDSILSRSANMRSKSTFMSMWTSFMGEPTTSINMIEDAIRQGMRGNKKYAAKAIGSVFTSMVLNSLLVSLVYAARDDDEDETYLEKYLASLTSELIEGINPLTYLPFFKDVWSSLQGFDIERADMSLITKLIESTQQAYKVYTEDTEDMSEEELLEHDKKVAEANWSIVDSISSLVGLPVKNLRRDINGAINLVRTVEKDLDGRKTTKGSLADKIEEAVRSSVPILGWGKGETKGDRLYDAVMAGDEVYAERFKSGFKSESSYTSTVIASLKDNDPRIREAAQARIDGDPAEYLRLAKEIIADGFRQDDVVKAINSMINSMSKEETTSDSNNVTGFFKIEDYYAAIANRDQAAALAVKKDIIDTKVANGKTEDEAEKSFYDSFYYEVRDAFDAGSVAAKRAKELLSQYGNKSEEDAAEIVDSWVFKAEYGFAYSDRADAYKSGNISAQELKEVLMEVGGKTEKEAELQIEVYDWQKAGIDIQSNQSYIVEDYKEYCEPLGISREVYFEAWHAYNDTSADVDPVTGEGIAYSKVKKVMPLIDALPISAEQKTAIALSWWAESTVRKYKTW